MRYKIGDIIFYQYKDKDNNSWAVYKIYQEEYTEAGDLYSLELLLTNGEFIKYESLLDKELNEIFNNYNDNPDTYIKILDDDEDIMGQITAYII